ncbi:MAG: hypothetical protein AAF494_03950 [Pseudomonadota bacterium]
METTRRQTLFASLAAAGGLSAMSQPLSGCAASDDASSSCLTQLPVLGAIHSNHRDSEAYSLEVLARAIRRAEPDLVLTEIPPSRLVEAKRSFAETGAVTEARTKVFPELTDVVFPLSQELGFEIVACAGWSQEIADNRRAALKAIENDPARAKEWAAYRLARAEYQRTITKARRDDPRFIHTRDYDVLVQRAQTPYQIYFDRDLGPGGWTQINAAHTGLIDAALDTISGRGQHALIVFGAWHKYMIERALSLRSDISLRDPLPLFA